MPSGPSLVLNKCSTTSAATLTVAISNHRLLDIENDRARFLWKDYRDNNQEKTMEIGHDRFTKADLWV